MRYFWYILMIVAIVVLFITVAIKNIIRVVLGKDKQIVWNPLEAFDPYTREDIYW